MVRHHFSRKGLNIPEEEARTLARTILWYASKAKNLPSRLASRRKYLSRIAKYKCVDYLPIFRNCARRDVQPKNEEKRTQALEREERRQFQGVTPTVQEVILRELSHLTPKVGGLVKELPKDLREVILMKYWQNKDVKSIARSLKIGASEVEARLRTAHNLLRGDML